MVLTTGQQRFWATSVFPSAPNGDVATLVFTGTGTSVGSIPWTIPLSAAPPANTSYFLTVSVIHPSADPVVTPIPPDAGPGVSPIMVINSTTPLAPLRRARSTLFKVVAAAATAGSITAAVDIATVAVRQRVRISISTLALPAGTPLTVALHRTTLLGGVNGAEINPYLMINGSLQLGANGSGGSCTVPACSASFTWPVPPSLNTAVAGPDITSLMATAARYVVVVKAPSAPTLVGRALLTVLASEPGTLALATVTSPDNLQPPGQGFALRAGADVTMTWTWSGPIANYSFTVAVTTPVCAAPPPPRPLVAPGAVRISAGTVTFRIPRLDDWPAACAGTPFAFIVAAVPPPPAQGLPVPGNAIAPPVSIPASAPWFFYLPPVKTLSVSLGTATPLQSEMPTRGALHGLQVGGRYASAVLLPGDPIPVAVGGVGVPDDAMVTLTLVRLHGGVRNAQTVSFNPVLSFQSVLARITVPAAEVFSRGFSFGVVQAAWLANGETLSAYDGATVVDIARYGSLQPVETAAAAAVDARAKATEADAVDAPPARYLRVLLLANASGGVVAPDSAPFALIAPDSALQAAVVQSVANFSTFASVPALRAGSPFVVSWSIAGLQSWAASVSISLHNDVLRPDGSPALRLANGVVATKRLAGVFTLPLALNTTAPADTAFYVRVTVDATDGSAATGNAVATPLFRVQPPLAGVAVSRIAPHDDGTGAAAAGAEAADLTTPARLCQGCRFAVAWSAAGAAAMAGVACNVSLRNAGADAAADDAAALGLGLPAASMPALATTLGLIRSPSGSISAFIPASADISGERAGAYFVRVSCAPGNGTAAHLLPQSSAANWTGESPRFQVTPPAASIIVTEPAAGAEFVAGSTDPSYGILRYRLGSPGLSRYPTGRIAITLHHAAHPNGSSTPIASVVTLDPTIPASTPFFVPASFRQGAVLDDLIADPALRGAFFLRATSVDFPAIAGESARFSIRPDGEPFFCVAGMAPGPANVSTGASVAELVRTPDGCLDNSAYPGSSFALLTADDAPEVTWTYGSFSGWESVSIYLRTSVAGYESIPLAVGGAAPTVAIRSFTLPRGALNSIRSLTSRNSRADYSLEMRVTHGSSSVVLSVFTPAFQIYANASAAAGGARTSLTQLRPPSAAAAGSLLGDGKRFVVGQPLELAWASVGDAVLSGGVTFDAMLLTSDVAVLAALPETVLAPSGAGVLLGRSLPVSGRTALTIPVDLANVTAALSADWQLQLSSPDGAHGVRSTFSLRIAPPAAALSLMTPSNASEVLLGEGLTIRWEGVALVGELSLELVYAGDPAATGLSGGAVTYPFATASAAAGAYRWSVPAAGSFPFPFGSVSAGLFTLRLSGRGAGGSAVAAQVTGLTMRPPQARIAVLQPAPVAGSTGSFSLNAPANITVQWATIGFEPSPTDFAVITLENDGTTLGARLTSFSLSDGAIAVSEGFAPGLLLPQSLLAGAGSVSGWRVRISSSAAPAVLGESEPFTLIGSPQLVRITSPLPGSQLEATPDFRIAYEVDPAIASNASLVQDANVTVTIATTIQYPDGSQSTVVTQRTGSLADGYMDVPLRGGGSMPVVTGSIGDSGLVSAGSATTDGGGDGGGGMRRRLSVRQPWAHLSAQQRTPAHRQAGVLLPTHQGRGRALTMSITNSFSSLGGTNYVASPLDPYSRFSTSSNFLTSFYTLDSGSYTRTTALITDTRNVTEINPLAGEDSAPITSLYGLAQLNTGTTGSGNATSGSSSSGSSLNITKVGISALDIGISSASSGGSIIGFDADVTLSLGTGSLGGSLGLYSVPQAFPRAWVPVFNRRRRMAAVAAPVAEAASMGSAGHRLLQSYSTSGSSSSSSASYSYSSSTSFGVRAPSSGAPSIGNYLSVMSPAQGARIWVVSHDTSSAAGRGFPLA